MREALPADEAALIGLFEACEDWFAAATGLPPAPGDVQSLLYALPEGAAPGAKRLLVVEAAKDVVGLVDVVLGHPGPGAAAVGVFLLAPEVRRAGLGTAVVRRRLEWGAAREGVRRVTATVPVGWAPGEGFLRALGFVLDAPGAMGAGAGNRRPGPREGTVRRAKWVAAE